MKTNFLKIEKPCKEEWRNMEPNEIGKFCKVCTKNVIDFTQLSQLEISNEIKNNNGSLCARLTSEQLKTPLVELKKYRDYKLPYSNVAAGLIIATTLSSCNQNLPVNESNTKIEYVQVVDSNLNSKDSKEKSESTNHKIKNSTKFKGKVFYENYKPIENAKVTFVSIKMILSTYTLDDGTFTIELPREMVDNDNVIRVSYQDIKNQKNEELFFGYDTQDYILTEKDISSIYKIQAKPMELILGGIGHYSEDWIPVVISNGKEIKYKDFNKAQQGEKSSCSLDNKDYYYFESESAIAIYGEKAKYGLYILIDKK
jgi:hypothetical protein